MNKRSSLFTVPSFLKWLLAGIILLIIIGGVYLSFLYKDIQNQKEAGFQTSEKLALDETPLATVDQVTRYHGDTYFHVVSGNTKSGKEALAFVPVEKENNQIQYFLLDDYLSKDALINEWSSDCQGCSLQSENWAIKNGMPYLELKYIEETGRFYVFEYISLENGKSYDIIRLQRSTIRER